MRRKKAFFFFCAKFQDYLIERNRKIVFIILLHYLCFYYKADGVHEKQTNKETNFHHTVTCNHAA